ncbi:4a-hydroxytetrahydrobiopterin dehydratase [Flavobacterium sp. 28A]|uniref:4a-hydroxytetrahydrobiopterin dehydratase n=1 Tax=Flavobacterium sp. 28A TaxID=2735895 RepID=UPI0015715C93|nr:4a-hydroxytetrahydrobiopterin dehydratase [Flavobacterium sp. 28A]NRT13776.1 4a-hydroxytetrahydrobiopterin dehydratase [Flavobacterium sp. 28A]
METYDELTSQPFLLNLKGWSYNNKGIEKKFEFKNFTEAIAFIVQLGFIAEKQNHHPELFNVYNKVNIRLSTHDAGGVTYKDFDLAKATNELL